MISEQEFSNLTKNIQKLLKEGNDKFLDEIGKDLNEISKLTPIERKKYQIDTNKINKLYSEYYSLLNKCDAEAKTIMYILAIQSINTTNKVLTYSEISKNIKNFSENSIAKQYADIYSLQSASDNKYYFNSSVINAYKENGELAYQNYTDAYISTLNAAKNIGYDNYYDAIKPITRQLADSGIKTFEYRSGIVKKMEYAVRSDVLWLAKQEYMGIQEKMFQETGANGYEISYHSNPRPSHAFMGGMQYSIDEFNSLGIQDYLDENHCYHMKFAIVMDITPSNYSKSELKELKEKDASTTTINGKEYTGYELSQRKNTLNNQVSNSKDRQRIYKASGDTKSYRTERLREQIAKEKLKSLSDI